MEEEVDQIEISEAWKVIDRWWTREPQVYYWATIRAPDDYDQVVALRFDVKTRHWSLHSHNTGEQMAEAKHEIDERLDRIELAIGTMAQWLVQAQTGFGAHDAEGIEKILQGKTPVRLKTEP